MTARGLVLETASALVAGLPDAAVLCDPSGRILVSNGAFVIVAGVKRRELDRAIAAGTAKVEDYLVPHVEGETLRGINQCLRERRVVRRDEVELKAKSGETLTVIEAFIPFFEHGGEPLAIMHTIRDVSAESRMQARYKDLVAMERARADDLERIVEQRTRELRIALDEVTRLSNIDALTGLMNRRALAVQAEQAVQMAKRHSRCLAVLIVDLDKFKQVNDVFGHQAGDAVLVAAARAMATALRKTDALARCGGEEFVAVLAEVERDAVREVAERCRQSISDIDVATLVPGMTGPQTASIGVALFPDHGEDFEALVARADKALYAAKAAGRNRVVMFEAQLEGEAPQSSQLTNRARVLIADADADRAGAYAAALAPDFDCELTATAEATLERCGRQNFEVVVAHEQLGNVSGLELLAQCLARVPTALRLLIIEDRVAFTRARSNNRTGIDGFILASDGSAHLRAAIEHARDRQVLEHERLLHQRAPVKPTAARVSATELDRLIDERGVRFVFQPILRANTLAIVAHEALARCSSAEYENPSVLFAAALRAGRLWELSRLVRSILAGVAKGVPHGTDLFINCHPSDLDDPQFVAGQELLRPHAHRVVFEITERAAIPDFERCKESLERLRALGYRFAVDDLGAGYASLNSVALLDPQFIKIDMMLVRGIDKNPRQAKLIRRIIEFGNDAGIAVIAEGVETAAEARCLVDMGVHLVQGFYFGKPEAELRHR